MGQVTDTKQDALDKTELTNLAELMPAYQRYLSHHLRNTLSALLCETELAHQDVEAGNIESVKNRLHRILVHCEHMTADLESVGL